MFSPYIYKKQAFQAFKMQDKITNEKLAKYFDITGRALKKVKIVDQGQINFKEASGMIKFLAESFLSELGIVLKEPWAI